MKSVALPDGVYTRLRNFKQRHECRTFAHAVRHLLDNDIALRKLEANLK